MPAEWADHECCWMQWPTDVTGDYSDIETWSHFDLDKARVDVGKCRKYIFLNLKS